ncbi:regulator of sirC expression with transglutaminase-like and TPR domain [Paraburkholderia sp. JPY465]
MITMSRVLDYFSTLVAEDESLPLTETALSLAQDAYPDLDLQSVLAEIDELVLRLRRRTCQTMPTSVRRLASSIGSFSVNSVSRAI